MYNLKNNAINMSTCMYGCNVLVGGTGNLTIVSDTWVRLNTSMI